MRFSLCLPLAEMGLVHQRLNEHNVRTRRWSWSRWAGARRWSAASTRCGWSRARTSSTSRRTTMFFQSLMMAGICRSLDSSAITCRQLYRSRLF